MNHWLLRGAFALLFLLGQNANAFQGEIKGYKSVTCAEKIGCVQVTSDSMSVSSNGKIMASEKAKVIWFNEKHEPTKILEVTNPVLFLTSEVLTWEGVGEQLTPGYVDLGFGKQRHF